MAGLAGFENVPIGKADRHIAACSKPKIMGGNNQWAGDIVYQQVFDARRIGQIEHGGRLVGKHQLRVAHEHGGKGQHLLLPARQAAASIALNNGETIKRVFEAVETVANAGGVPLIMSYWNLVYHYGVERFARDFENAGGAGLITPDLIPDEAGEWIEASDRHGLDRIFLVSPDSSTERLETVARNARGFV